MLSSQTAFDRRRGARKFVEKWSGKGYEKGEGQSFWISLLKDVFGVKDPEGMLIFEQKVYDRSNPTKRRHLGFIDVRIPSTRVLIEQKGLGHPLEKPELQSDGATLTPFQQGKRYADNLAGRDRPRWVVACNFETFEIHDLDADDPTAVEVVQLKDLEREYHRLEFLVDAGDENVRPETRLSIAAGELVGRLYDGLLAQYREKDSEAVRASLNKLCVRLVFCLYAEDAGLFNHKSQFHDYLRDRQPICIRSALRDLFKILDTPEECRNPEEPTDLLEFPYVNGGLFADDSVSIPQFTQELKDLLLKEASEGFNWADISPTIFGAVFESTLNPETRRKSGMHYTSVENIEKVINPLFMDDLNAEFAAIMRMKTERARRTRLTAFQEKLGSLKFLDPACGSGNFLTETYVQLRRLENKVILELNRGQGQLVLGNASEHSPVKVTISQFYGMEINDFACSVSETALWIAESQMLAETSDILGVAIDFFPMKTNTNIHECNALRTDWETIVPKNELSFIMGNPPFVGHNLRTDVQKDDLKLVFGPLHVDKSDYVIAWFYLAAKYLIGTSVNAAFVSTNSICQGTSVSVIWKQVFNMGCHIDFAWRTFMWDSEASEKAHVHVVIVGFSECGDKEKVIYSSDGKIISCKNINGYLQDAPNVCVERVRDQISGMPEMKTGSLPRSSAFTLTPEDRDAFIRQNPICEPWIRPYIGSDEFLNGGERYCLWLKGVALAEIKRCPLVLERVEKVRADRLASKAATTRRVASTPTLFAVDAQPSTDYIAVPQVSSERRPYIPIGFVSADVISSNLLFIIPSDSKYLFGVLMSSVHMSWMRTVCGRLKSDYRYSKDVVYNSLVFPECNARQLGKIEKTADAILQVRAKYKEKTLSELYDPLFMPADLQAAHHKNDAAVLEAYGLPIDSTEEGIVAHLMDLFVKAAPAQGDDANQ